MVRFFENIIKFKISLEIIEDIVSVVTCLVFPGIQLSNTLQDRCFSFLFAVTQLGQTLSFFQISLILFFLHFDLRDDLLDLLFLESVSRRNVLNDGWPKGVGIDLFEDKNLLIAMVNQRQGRYVTAHIRFSLTIFVLVHLTQSFFLSLSLFLQFINVILHKIAAGSLDIWVHWLVAHRFWIRRSGHLFWLWWLFGVVGESVSFP